MASVDAKLPVVYRTAQRALAECTRVDECRAWADKAKALASYARQSKDRSLFTYAQRIQARAIRRGGELFQQIRPAKGGRPGAKTGTAGGTSSRKEAAAVAGVSKRQKDTMLRVAAVPAEDFERQVESEQPPTVTELARQGTKTVVDYRGRSTTEQFKSATHTLARIEDLATFAAAHDPEEVARGVGVTEFQRAREHLQVVMSWLSRFGSALDREETKCAENQ